MFHSVQAEAAMSDNVIPIKSFPRMYVSMDVTGVPVVKLETVDRRGKDGGQAKTHKGHKHKGGKTWLHLHAVMPRQGRATDTR